MVNFYTIEAKQHIILLTVYYLCIIFYPGLLLAQANQFWLIFEFGPSIKSQVPSQLDIKKENPQLQQQVIKLSLLANNITSTCICLVQRLKFLVSLCMSANYISYSQLSQCWVDLLSWPADQLIISQLRENLKKTSYNFYLKVGPRLRSFEFKLASQVQLTRHSQMRWSEK